MVSVRFTVRSDLGPLVLELYLCVRPGDHGFCLELPNFMKGEVRG